MAVNPSYSANFTVVDRSGETSGFNVPLAEAIDIADLAANTAYGNWITALGTVIDGTILQVNGLDSKRLSNAAFANAGQREEKWLCSYQDDVTLAQYAMEIPCRKQSGTGVLPPTGRDDVDLTASPWLAFKTAFEAFVKSRDQNAVTLLEVRLVGRNA